jgi:hypothetical protein
MAAELKRIDGLLIEVETTEGGKVFTSAGDKLMKGVAQIPQVLKRITAPIIDTWHELSKEVSMEEAEVELGLSFEGEGNVYITKAKAGGNLVVKLKFKAIEPTGRSKPQAPDASSGRSS